MTPLKWSKCAMLFRDTKKTALARRWTESYHTQIYVLQRQQRPFQISTAVFEHFNQSQFTLPFISHFPVPSQMPLFGYTAFILPDVLNFKWRGQGENHQFRHQSMCHLFFVLKSYCVTIKGRFLQLLKIKSWAWPENPPLEFLGRVGDV